MLADISISSNTSRKDDIRNYQNLVKNKVFKWGTHAIAIAIADKESFKHLEEKYDTQLYQSTDTVMSENPFHNWISNKKWPLNEELNMHMLRFQQVRLQCI